jgi:hypothetical protein
MKGGAEQAEMRRAARRIDKRDDTCFLELRILKIMVIHSYLGGGKKSRRKAVLV